MNISRLFHGEDILLAALGRETRLVVVVEEGIESSTVDVDGGGIDEAETPGFAA